MQTSTVDLSTALVRSPRLVQCELDGEVTMMSVDTGKYYALTSVAVRIWNILERPTPVSGICDRLTEHYRVDRSQCETEVLSFVHHLVEEGVAVVATESTPQ